MLKTTHLMIPLLSGMLLISACKKKTTDPQTIIVQANDTYASLTTAPVDSIMGQFAVSGGEVTSEGNSAITAAGICWDTKPAPTTLRSRTNEGAGTGSFRSVLYGLKPSTTYFVRAYATNALGTAYGNEVSFKTPTGWTKISNNNGPYQFNSIHSKGTRLFAGSQGSYKIYVSDNDGVSWSVAGNNLGNYAICFATTAGGNILVGTNGYGIYSSSDNGSSWISSSSGMPFANITSLLVNGNTIFAGTYSSGLYKSTNNGINWTQSGTGLVASVIRGLTVTGSTILAATEDGVYRSTDNGNSWQLSNSGITGNLDANSIAMCGPNVFVAMTSGLYRSSDNGANWVPVNLSNINYTSLLTSGKNGVCWSNNNVYVTSNNGATWVSNIGGLSGGIVAVGTNGSAFYASTYNGEIYKLSIE